NNATASYDDLILVIEVFDDDKEESNYELKESIINAFQLFMKNLAKEYELIEENVRIRAEKLVLVQENERIRAKKLVLEQENDRIRAIKLVLEQEMNESGNLKKSFRKKRHEQIDDEESINAMNYNFVKETSANSVKEKDMNKESHDIERIRKEKDKRNFTNSEYSSDNVKKQKFKKIQKRFLAALEIKRLLNKLYTIDPSLAYT
ncbi:3318_t:CDS:2, partial [Gigaspora margarita]